MGDKETAILYLITQIKYNPETGEFSWRKRIPGRHGNCGSRKPSGYHLLSFVFEGKQWYITAHRLAFIIKEGKAPKYVDHKNGVRHDNRWENLRAATSSQNAMNRSKRPLGVCWIKASQKWRAYLKINRKQLYLGEFTDKKDAMAARRSAEEKHHKEFASNKGAGQWT